MEPKELLAKARQMVARMRADGVPDTEIDQYLQSEIQLGLEQVTSPDVDDYLRAAGMGLTAGWLDELAGAGAAIVPGGRGYTEARDEVRANYDAANEAATGLDQFRLVNAELGGGAVGALLGGGAIGLAAKGMSKVPQAARAIGTGAKALRGLLAGSGAGGVAGAGYSEKEAPAGILGDAAVGAAVGGVVGGAVPVAGAALKGVRNYAADVVNPGRSVVREASNQLGHVPGGATNVMARQEALAPGTAIQGDLSPELVSLMRGVGADQASANKAREIAASRIKDIKAAFKPVQARYKQHEGTMLKVTPEVMQVLEKHGKGKGPAAIAPNGVVDFTDVQKLRSRLLDKLRTTKKGHIKQEVGPQVAVLDDFLTKNVPGIDAIDSDWKFLLQRLSAAEDLEHVVTESAKTYATQRAYGVDPASAGGSLPSIKPGMLGRLMSFLEPNRADRARAAQHLLMTPNLAPSIGAGEASGGLLNPWPSVGGGMMGGRAAAGLLAN